jgi:2-polyprenyl-6-methoxyphenol hydroxylase-like FAD-dependent oxidoreductase
VVGAGPIGLITALELNTRGIEVLVVERNESTTRHPKMDVTNGRSMEHFRRLGVAERIRDAAVPRENCMDVSWVSRLGEWELARFRYPNVHEWRAKIAQHNDGTMPLEPNMRLSQVVLEPELHKVLTEKQVDIRFGWAFESLEQDEEGVTAVIREVATGATETVRCQLLAGCDGGSSKVREHLDIKLEGAFAIVRAYMVHFKTSAKDLMQKFGVAWHYQAPVHGTLIAQDDDQIWTIQNVLPEGIDPATVVPEQFAFDCLGMEFPIEVLQANTWTPHLVVANGYGKGRVWMAGDSVHQYIPTGGFGMNTGVCDAVDLSWKFAALLQGWGGPKLLPSIEAERLPVGLRNCEAAGANMGVRFQIMNAYTPVIHEDSEQGAAARSSLGALITELGNAENESLGIELGYRYRNSPIVCGEGDEPQWRMLDYVPSTWPGVRAPHLFLEDGSAIFDHFGPWFTLLRFNDQSVESVVEAAKKRGVPLTIVDVRDANARSIYERNLVLIRPDQHVAWRGNSTPDDALAVIDRVRGA